MIIRLSDKNDINGIITLWNEAFGDGENEIIFFLDNKYVPENTLIIEENGTLASMLFLLEGNMRINGESYPSYYLYAACTAKQFRGKGFMAELLAEANRIASLKGKDFICLMPGEKSLFDFYEKHGYLTVFNKKILTVNRSDFDFFCETEEHSCESLQILRNNAFSPFDFFEWDNSSIEFAFSHNKLYSGTDISDCKGYLLYTENDGIVTVKEFAFTEENLINGLALLFTESKCKKALISLPSQYKTTVGDYSILPSAMIYPVSMRSKNIVQNLNNAYLGLTLD